MDQKIREMQERLDKVGTAGPFVPPVQNLDYSEMQSRLDKVSTGYRAFVAPAVVVDRSEMQARLNNAAPVAKTVSIPTPKVITQELPVAKPIPSLAVAPKLPEPIPPKQKSIDVPISKHVQASKPEIEPQSSHPSLQNIAPDNIEPSQSAEYSPRIAPQAKGRSSWILWLGIALFVAIVIAQLIWVMS